MWRKERGAPDDKKKEKLDGQRKLAKPLDQSGLPLNLYLLASQLTSYERIEKMD